MYIVFWGYEGFNEDIILATNSKDLAMEVALHSTNAEDFCGVEQTTEGPRYQWTKIYDTAEYMDKLRQAMLENTED